MIESSDKLEIEGLEKKFKEDIKSRIDETAKYYPTKRKYNGLRIHVYNADPYSTKIY